MTSSQFGLFARLAFSYWETGLPLPEGAQHVARLANADTGTVQRHEKIVSECLAIIMPELERRYDKRLTGLVRQRMHAANIRRIKELKTCSKRMADNPMLSDESEASAVIPTIIFKNYRDSKDSVGNYDQSARKTALQAPKKPEKTLTDE